VLIEQEIKYEGFGNFGGGPLLVGDLGPGSRGPLKSGPAA